MARVVRALGTMELPPKMMLSDAIPLTRRIAEHFKDSEFSDQSLAAALGHKAEKSGSFRQKIADLRRYGGLDGRGDKLRASRIALMLYHDHPGDSERAALEMLENIPAFKALHDRFGTDLPEQNILVSFLLDYTGAPRPEVEREAVNLRELYNGACGMVPSMRGGTKPPVTPSAPTARSYGAPPGSFSGKRFAVSAEDYEFSVADEPATIEDVVEQLQAHKRALERRREAGRADTKSAEASAPSQTT